MHLIFRSQCQTLVSLCLLTLGSALHLSANTELNIPGYRLQWYDEFEASVVDTTKWDIAEGINAGYGFANGDYFEPQWFNEDITGWSWVNPINSEEQYYSPNNVSVNSGVLEIEARLETVPQNERYGAYDPNYHRYTSGKLNTADEFQFQFGIVKWSAQLPAGDGMWPALWMLNDPQNDPNPPDYWFWDDEIDVMEARGSEPFITTSAHHYKLPNGDNRYRPSDPLDTGINLQTSFNEYGLEWTSANIQTTFNGEHVFFDNLNIPQEPMFLIMNAAVGGFFDPAPVDDAVLAAGTTFSIDWVRVWQPSAKPSDLSNGGFEDFQGPQWADWNTIDDGNVSTVSVGALHGSSSVRIDALNSPAPISQIGPNLLDDAGPWSGYLNETTVGSTTGGPVSPSSIPATTNGNTATISIHATSGAATANSVIYRQLPASALFGLNITFSGSVAITETFATGTAIAFIRVFNLGYGSFTDYTATVTTGGDFSIQAAIPASGIEAVQFGLETTGTPGSNGVLTVTDLYLVDDDATSPVAENLTRFEQTVVVTPGQSLRYGGLVLNDPADPLSFGAEAHLRLDFLTSTDALVGRETYVLADSTSSTTEAAPYTALATVPSGTTHARLTIERITVDELTDTGGAFIADAAFLQVTTDSELPVFTALPPTALTAAEGSSVTIPITVTSPTALSYQWYFKGTPVSTAEDYSFTATLASTGRYFVIASNAAGPVLGGWTDLSVTLADSDNDLIIDVEEINIYGTNPNKADTDGDGDDDYTEIFVTRTDPNDPASFFRLTSAAIVGGNVELTFPSVLNVLYTFEASADLENWQPIGTTHRGDGTSSAVSMALPVTDPPLIYFRANISGYIPPKTIPFPL